MTTGTHPGGFGGVALGGARSDRPQARRRPFSLRALRGVGGTLGLLLVFLLALVGGALAHLDTPRARNLVVHEVNATLAPMFRGTVRLDALAGVSLRGVRGLDATVDDPTGRPVIVARGVSVRLATLALVRSLLGHAPEPLTVHVYSASIGDAHVVLDHDAEGHLLLENAFAPANPKPPPPPNPNPRRLRIMVDQFTLAHVRAQGALAGGRSLDVAGALQARLDQGAEADAIPDAMLNWDGSVGAIASSVRASVNPQRVDAVVDVPPFAASALRALVPDVPLERRGAAHVEVHGPPSDVQAKLQLVVDDATLDGTASYVGFRSAEVSHGDADLTLHQGNLGKTWVPDATLHATASLRGSSLVRALADLSVEEPGAPTRLTMQATPRGGEQPVVDFELESSSSDLTRVPQLAHAVRGSYRLSFAGRLDPNDRVIEGDLHATARGVGHGSAGVDEATIDGRAHGPLGDPVVYAAVRAGGLHAGSNRVDAAEVTAYGPAMSPHLVLAMQAPTLPNIEGSTDVALGHGVVLSSLRLALSHAGQLATVAARRIELGGAAGGGLQVDDARVDGLGQPLLASATLGPAALHVRATTAGLDLARIARLAHVEKNLGAGSLGLDVDLNIGRRGAEGRARVDLTCAAIGEARDVDAHVAGSIQGRHVAAAIRASARDIGTFTLNAPALNLASDETRSLKAWRDAWGDVTFDADVDLGRMTALVPRQDLPLSEARGRVVARGHLERDDGHDFTPDFGLSLHTQDLVLAPRTPVSRDIDYVWVTPKPPWRLVGVDLDVDAHVDGQTGGTQLSLRARDHHGEIAQIDTSAATLPFEEFFHDKQTLDARLLRTPVELRFTMPERGLWTLPESLQQPFLTGRASAEVRASGTALAPHLDARVLLRGSRFQADVTAVPIDVELDLLYDGERANLDLRGVSKGSNVLDLKSLVHAPVAPLLEHTGPLAWNADTKVHFDGFPLQSIPVLDDKLIAGEVRGDLDLTGLHQDARVRADLNVDDLRVGGVAYRSGALHARADGQGLDADLRIDQSDGFVETTAHASATWGASLAPTLDPKRPLEASLDAKRFRLGGLEPMVQGVLDEIDGRLDGGVRVQLDPSTRSARMSGGLALSEGRFQASAGGGEFHDVSGQVQVTPDGVIALQKLTAYGMSGYLEASGKAQMRGTSLESAHASITIPSNAAVPLSASGTSVGDVDGRFDITATARGNTMNVEVNVPEARVALPQASSGHAQALGPMKNVRIGAHRGDAGKLVTFPLDPMKGVKVPEGRAEAQAQSGELSLAVKLQDVQVVRGKDLTVALGGNLKVDTSGGGASGPAVTGQINLKPGGRLSVQGKTFTVEHGTVTFVDDPANPQVVVKASYQAQDGTLVYADFVGPLKTGKVTLSSEPPLPRQEIVELLLFGTTSGPQPQTPAGTPATQAITTVGGEATQPLNHMLNQLGLGAVTAKVGSSEAGTAQPE
ncbi:MAG TPA: translocation/assembly module TamB domain-containing protein, partial [Polyangiaceae bacterium]